MQYCNLQAVAEIFKSIPEESYTLTEVDERYEEEYTAIDNLISFMNGHRETDDWSAKMGGGVVKWSLEHHTGEDGLLCRLTELAESEDPKIAAEANYTLARLYLALDRPKGLKMPYNREIALGFFAAAIRLGHKKAKEEYCLLADEMQYYSTALHTVPDDKYTKDARTAYYRHCIRMLDEIGGSKAEEMGAILPDLDEDGLIPEQNSEAAAGLRDTAAACMKKASEHTASLLSRANALEHSITQTMLNLSGTIEDLGHKAVKAMKRSKRIKRLVLLAYLIFYAIGAFSEPEQIPTLLYLPFLIPNTFYILKNYEITSLQEFLSVSPGSMERGLLLVLGLIAIPIVYYLVLWIIRVFILKGDCEDRFLNQKSALLKKHGLDRIAAEAQRILSSEVSFSAELNGLGLKNRYGTLDELAALYHATRFTSDPRYVYANASSRQTPWEYEYTIPAWFRSDSGITANTFYESDGEPVAAVRQFEQYETTFNLLKLLKEELHSGKDRSTSFPPWDMESLWHFAERRQNYLLRYRCEEVLLEMFEPHIDAGDAEAAYRLGKTFFPTTKGEFYAQKALHLGHHEASSLLANYNRHDTPYQENIPQKNSEEVTFRGMLREAALKHDEKAREHNEAVIDAARIRGDISAEEAAELKRKHGNLNRW